jgi:hypothetical protein
MSVKASEDPSMAGEPTGSQPCAGEEAAGTRERRIVVLELDTFAWETLAEQSAELAVPVDELVTFSVLYYLADRDSQRISRRPPAELRSPPHPGD